MKKNNYWRFTIIAMLISISLPAFSQFTANPLSQAVDNTKFDFFTETPRFFSQTREVNFDGDAAQSAAIGNEGVSLIAAQVSFSTTTRVSFDWQVSSERFYDELIFVVFDLAGNPRNIQASISGEVSWNTRSFNVPAGQHFLAWGYLKNGSVSQGQDAGWVDNVRIGNSGGETPQAPEDAPIASLAAIIDLLLFENTPKVPEPPLDEANIYPPNPVLTEAGPHLILESTPGDFIGQGHNYHYTQLNANFSISSNSDNGVKVSMGGYSGVTANKNETWTLNLSNGSSRLTVGRYQNARRFPLNNTSENGLSFHGTGRICGQLSGEFNIYDIEYSADILVKLTADFVQRCESSATPLRGSIRYDASLSDASFPGLPATTGSPTPTLPMLAGSGTVIEIEGAAGDYVTSGSDFSFNDSNSTITASATNQNRGIRFSINNGSLYSLEFRAGELDIDNANGMLTTGVHENALRAVLAAPQPGLSFTGGGRGCNASLGTFSVYEIAFDASNEITKLLADFDQLCDSSSAPLKGSINYVR